MGGTDGLFAVLAEEDVVKNARSPIGEKSDDADDWET